MGDVDEAILCVVSSEITYSDEEIWILTLKLTQHQHLAF